MKLNEISPLGQGIVGIALATFLLSSPDSGLAQSSYMQSKSSNLYRAHETSMDIFAGYVNAQRGITHLFQTGLRHGSMGGGFGVNYFSSEHLGFGTDLVIPNNGGSFVDSYTMNVIYRMPLGSSGLAPSTPCERSGNRRMGMPSKFWLSMPVAPCRRWEQQAGLKPRHSYGVAMSN